MKLVKMKYKILTYSLLTYIILYHFVFECLSNFYDFFLDLESGSRIFTPLGRIIRKLIFNEHNIEIYYYGEVYIFLFNLFIGSILFYFAYKWYGKENVIITFLKLLGIFIVINFLIIVYVIIDYSFATTFIYLFYFLIPMSVMLILILPTFWLNAKIQKII